MHISISTKCSLKNLTAQKTSHRNLNKTCFQYQRSVLCTLQYKKPKNKENFKFARSVCCPTVQRPTKTATATAAEPLFGLICSGLGLAINLFCFVLFCLLCFFAFYTLQAQFLWEQRV